MITEAYLHLYFLLTLTGLAIVLGAGILFALLLVWPSEKWTRVAAEEMEREDWLDW